MSSKDLRAFMPRQDLVNFILLALVIFVVMPLSMDIFRLNLVGKYLTYAFVAVGLVLCWGYGGILSLGQGVFFGLGGYCMAMFLKLEASSPENTKIQSTPGIPDFMDWNQLTELPWFWEPFYNLPFAIIAVLVVPTIFAYIIGVAMFKRRVGGVYFAIITQAVASILTILIIGQQYVTKSKLGRILVAMREREDRVRFTGYDVSNFKIFVFCFGAMLSAIGGAMFTLQVGFMSPSFVGIVPSIEMVIFCAVGGRLSIVGAVYGTLLINWAKTTFSESFPELWLFAMGALFIGVVMAFPTGLAGVYNDYVGPFIDKWRHKLKSEMNTKMKDSPEALPTK